MSGTSRRGFTLLETLIAIVLIAVALPVALAGVTSSIQVAGQVSRRDLARHLAESQLALLLSSSSWATSAQSGDFDPLQSGAAASGFHWQLSIAPWRDPAVDTVSLTVTWDPPAPTHALTLATLVAVPTTASTATPTSTITAPSIRVATPTMATPKAGKVGGK